MFKKEKNFKICPRCGFKTFNKAKVCGNCDLNFEKFEMATNSEGKDAIRKGERERVVWTRKLPKDLSKKKLLITTILFGWTGIHLFKVGKLGRAIFNMLGLISFGVCLVLSLYNENIAIRNIFTILGFVWILSVALVISDIIDIIFNRFKVPVSLPYSKNKEEK